MIRSVTLAALAAAVGLPASAAIPTAYVSTTGKSPTEVRADIRRAADALCAKAEQGVVLPLEAHAACVANAVKATLREAALDPSTKAVQR